MTYEQIKNEEKRISKLTTEKLKKELVIASDQVEFWGEKAKGTLNIRDINEFGEAQTRQRIIEVELEKRDENKMKIVHAKSEGYEVIDEFERNIASIVWLEFEDNNVVKVIDEFERNIIKRVHVKKDGQEVKRIY